MSIAAAASVRARRALGAFEVARNGVLVVLAMLAAVCRSAGGAMPVCGLASSGGLRAASRCTARSIK